MAYGGLTSALYTYLNIYLELDHAFAALLTNFYIAFTFLIGIGGLFLSESKGKFKVISSGLAVGMVKRNI